MDAGDDRWAAEPAVIDQTYEDEEQSLHDLERSVIRPPIAKEEEQPIFECKACDRLSPIWHSRCPYCGSSDTLGIKREATFSLSGRSKKPDYIENISSKPILREDCGVDGLNWVHTGTVVNGVEGMTGIPDGSCTIIGGEPSIGKSTLLMQVAIRSKYKSCIYFCGEESAAQVADRAMRVSMGDMPRRKVLIDEDIRLENMIRLIEQRKPPFVIIDSVQKVYAEKVQGKPGGATQITNFCTRFIKPCKSYGITLYIVGQVTKQGIIAGPRTLEHEVDIINFMDGNPKLRPRRVTCTKNRFGEAGRSTIFVMGPEGLRTHKKLTPSDSEEFEEKKKKT